MMPEWVKILLTALAAFSVGVISEPLKLVIGNWFKKRNMRNSLYRELVRDFGHLWMFLRTNERPFEDFYTFLDTEGFSVDVYKWTKSQLDVFYQLAEGGAIDN